jgi:hypothetical protein
MSQLVVQLTDQHAAAHGGKGALLSFQHDTAFIRLFERETVAKLFARPAEALMA